MELVTASPKRFILQDEWRGRDLDRDHVALLAEVLDSGGALPPVDVVKLAGDELALVDGYHRFAAHRSVGTKRIPYVVVGEGVESITWHLAHANSTHGKSRTDEGKRHAVRLALRAPEGAEANNATIARWCGVSVDLVRRVREDERGAPSAAAERRARAEAAHRSGASSEREAASTAGVTRHAVRAAAGRIEGDPRSNQRPTQTTVTYDGDPGPDDEVFEHPSEDETVEAGAPDTPPAPATAAPAPSSDRLIVTKGNAGRDGQGFRPAGDGAPDYTAPEQPDPPAKPRPWREVLEIPAGPVAATTVVEAYERLSRFRSSDRAALDELRRARALALSQWFSQEKDADLVVEVALSLCGERKALSVLEPSAGEGALIQGLMRAVRTAPRGRFGALRIVAVEVDPHHVVDLETACDPVPKGCAFTVVESDFLNPSPELAGLLADGTFDLTLTNPPYEAGADGAFLEAAMRVSNRVVAFLRLNALTGQRRHEAVWSQVATMRHPERPWRLRRMEVFPKRPGFDGPGEDSAKSDYVIVGLVHERVLEQGDRDVQTLVGWP